MTPTEILAELNKSTPYRPNDKCHFCLLDKPAHEPTCIWLEVEAYDNVPLRLVEMQQLVFQLLSGATLQTDNYGPSVYINKRIRVSPALRRLAARLGISVGAE